MADDSLQQYLHDVLSVVRESRRPLTGARAPPISQVQVVPHLAGFLLFAVSVVVVCMVVLYIHADPSTIAAVETSIKLDPA